MVSRTEVEEMFQIIEGDDKLGRRLAKIIVRSIRYNSILRRDLMEIINRELRKDIKSM